MKAFNKRKITMLIVSFFILAGLIMMTYYFINKKAITNPAKNNPSKTENLTPVKQEQNKVKTQEVDFKKLGIPLKYNDEGVPVLMFHSINTGVPNNSAIIPVEKFREDMEYLRDNGYYTLTLDEVYSFLSENKPLPAKAVVITFDDGYEDNYINAYPILKEFGFKGTIFVITSYIDRGSNYLTSSQLKELDDNGIDIESHTITHPDALMKLSYEDQLQELKGSKEFLEKLLSKDINYIAYPYGVMNVNIDKNTVKAAGEAGYKLAFTTDGRWADKTDGLLTLDRVFISPQHSLTEFGNRISNPQYKVN